MGFGTSMCTDCHRAHRTAQMAALREKKRIELMADNDSLETTGWRICSKCHHKRMVSEFGTSQGNRMGKLNKICDKCLTRMYLSPARVQAGFNENYWRRRAYTANSVARQRYARLYNIKISDVRLSDLEWVCKPQDLAKLYDDQHGKCIYCGVELKPEETQIEHVLPLSKGGRHNVDNISLACRDCNYLKNSRNGEDFMKFLEEYAQRVLKKIAEDRDKEPDR